MERQDANAIAYRSDVTARMLLSGSVDVPDWAKVLTQTLEDCTGMPGGRKWVQDLSSHSTGGGSYMFNGQASPGSDSSGPATLKKKERPGYFRRTSSNSMWDFRDRSQDHISPIDDEPHNGSASRYSPPQAHAPRSTTTPFFETQFDSDFVPDSQLRKHPKLTPSPTRARGDYDDENDDPFGDEESHYSTSPPSYTYSGRPSSSVNRDFSHRRATSAYTPKPMYPNSASTTGTSGSRRGHGGSVSSRSDIEPSDWIEDLDGRPPPGSDVRARPKIFPSKSKAEIELEKPLNPNDGVARAVALYDFKAVQVCRVMHFVWCR